MTHTTTDTGWTATDRTGTRARGAQRGTRVVRGTKRRPLSRLRGFRITKDMVEAASLLLVVALLLVGVGVAVGGRLLPAGSAPVVTVEVQPGDTLWSLAERYGSPNEYILKRVDRLSSFNQLPRGAHLHAGQTLLVPVENPTELQRAVASGAITE